MVILRFCALVEVDEAKQSVLQLTNLWASKAAFPPHALSQIALAVSKDAPAMKPHLSLMPAAPLPQQQASQGQHNLLLPPHFQAGPGAPWSQQHPAQAAAAAAAAAAALVSSLPTPTPVAGVMSFRPPGQQVRDCIPPPTCCCGRRCGVSQSKVQVFFT